MLLGECDPASLIDEPELSPFNVTQSIPLDDFSRHDLDLFATELNLTAEQARQAFALCREERIPTWAMFMTHVPGETPATLQATHALAEELDAPLGSTFQRFSPLPGSYFWGHTLEPHGVVCDRTQVPGTFGPVGFKPNAFL